MVNKNAESGGTDNLCHRIREEISKTGKFTQGPKQANITNPIKNLVISRCTITSSIPLQN